MKIFCHFISRITFFIVFFHSCNYGISNFFLNEEPITIYSHGLLCNKFVAHLFHILTPDHTNRWCPEAFITGPIKSFNYNDCVMPLLSYFGQDDDIKRLHKACKNHKKVILVGTSRGASAIINYLGTYKPTNIIAAVLESPYDNTEKIAEYYLNSIFKNYLSASNKKRFKDILNILFFINYKHDALQPEFLAQHISHTIPLLLIASEEDVIIPHWSTKNLYDALLAAGHPKTYLLTCRHGKHGLISWGKEGKKLKEAVHAFYHQHNIPHHPEWAQGGYDHFCCSTGSESKD